MDTLLRFPVYVVLLFSLYIQVVHAGADEVAISYLMSDHPTVTSVQNADTPGLDALCSALSKVGDVAESTGVILSGQIEGITMHIHCQKSLLCLASILGITNDAVPGVNKLKLSDHSSTVTVLAYIASI